MVSLEASLIVLEASMIPLSDLSLAAPARSCAAALATTRSAQKCVVGVEVPDVVVVVVVTVVVTAVVVVVVVTAVLTVVVTAVVGETAVGVVVVVEVYKCAARPQPSHTQAGERSVVATSVCGRACV